MYAVKYDKQITNKCK